MGERGTLYLLWDPSLRSFRAVERPPRGERIVADSFALIEGKGIALKKRIRRFLRFCRALLRSASPPSLWSAFPPGGGWFPRLELIRGEDRLHLGILLRPLPQRVSSFHLRFYPHPDPRRFPERKGPDLDLLQAIRRGLSPEEELILCDEEGRIREGSRTTLFLYDGETFLFPTAPFVVRAVRSDNPLPEDRRVQKEKVMRIYRGFTRRILRDALLPLGLYREVELKVEEIEGKEIYCSNSLHGVVPVVEREGIPLTLPRRSAFLQRILEEALESLPEEGRMEKGWKRGI